MVNKILAAFVLADILFAAGGAIMLGFAVVVQQTCFNVPTEGVEAARHLLYREFPFNVGIANAVLTFIIFAFTLPGLATGSRGWLKVAGYLVVFNAIFTLGIGLNLWTTTLKMRERFSAIWVAQDAEIQSLMQTAIFTAVFGMVGLDAIFIMALACLLKDRKERERYRHIDEKSGARRGGF
ncbi:tetraspanin [Microdochium trichocladiopsis]|uniref:Tetraspanin n=1 Tax=Microdochium trichocladiopsis TaxID=1682393 RepID=A0A9P8YER9_9PEZI|nr:tetraspanin [Microdochium trichocladiopsis]KAH7037567.1 tetraspanin [Microdochium trichocladiopsis]